VMAETNVSKSGVPKTEYRKNVTNPKRGSTLVEVLMALVVFAVLTTMFGSSVIVAKSSSQINGQYSQAVSLCQHKVDQLRAVGFGRLNYTELNDAGIIDDAPTSSPFSFLVVDGVSEYLASPTATVTIASHATESRVKVATVTVSWRAGPRRAGNSSSYTVRAYIANVE